MSYTYTAYHHHQFDRQFSLPLPMPSPTSCWYPQRQDVQFGYSYLDSACPIPALSFSAPRPSLVSDLRPDPDPPDGPPLYTASQPPYQSLEPPSPPYQPPYNGVDHMEPLGMPHDPVTQDLEPNLAMAALVSKLEHLIATVRELVSRMDDNDCCVGELHAQLRSPPALPNGELPNVPSYQPDSYPPPPPYAAPEPCQPLQPLPVTTPFMASNRYPQVDVPSSSQKEWKTNLQNDEDSLCQSRKCITERDEELIELGRMLKQKEKENDFTNGRREVNENFSELIKKEIKVEAHGSSLEAKINDLIVLPNKPNKNKGIEIQSIVEAFVIKEPDIEVGREEKRRLFADDRQVRTGESVMKESTIFDTMETWKKRGQRQTCVFDPGGGDY